MARALSSAVVLALLAATAVAFAVTEGAKLERSPIYGTRVPYPVFSPNGRSVPVAKISFRLRTRERVEVWMQNAAGKRVDTLLAGRTFARGARINLVWDGLSAVGVLQPDGSYTPVVRLARSHRTIVLPSPVRLDTVPPVITVRHPRRAIILSPDGDGHADVYRVTYRVNEPAHGILSVDDAQQSGIRVNFTLRQRLTGELLWNGKLDGKPVPRGRYVLEASAQDRAGNVSKSFAFALVQVRYVVLARSRIDVHRHARFAIRVSTDAPSVHWRFNRASGTQHRGTLHFRAPRKPGTYHLFVTVGSHAARCTVVVS